MIKTIRGAISVGENTETSIQEATTELLTAILAENRLKPKEIINVTFSATKDINAAYPAKFAREMGWNEVPMFCVQEMDVADALPMCLRVLILIKKDKVKKIKHVYLRDAQTLRPDLIK